MFLLIPLLLPLPLPHLPPLDILPNLQPLVIILKQNLPDPREPPPNIPQNCLQLHTYLTTLVLTQDVDYLERYLDLGGELRDEELTQLADHTQPELFDLEGLQLPCALEVRVYRLYLVLSFECLNALIDALLPFTNRPILPILLLLPQSLQSLDLLNQIINLNIRIVRQILIDIDQYLFLAFLLNLPIGIMHILQIYVRQTHQFCLRLGIIYILHPDRSRSRLPTLLRIYYLRLVVLLLVTMLVVYVRVHSC